jgi:hypothetical protein
MKQLSVGAHEDELSVVGRDGGSYDRVAVLETNDVPGIT